MAMDGWGSDVVRVHERLTERGLEFAIVKIIKPTVINSKMKEDFKTNKTSTTTTSHCISTIQSLDGGVHTHTRING